MNHHIIEDDYDDDELHPTVRPMMAAGHRPQSERAANEPRHDAIVGATTTSAASASLTHDKKLVVGASLSHVQHMAPPMTTSTTTATECNYMKKGGVDWAQQQQEQQEEEEPDTMLPPPSWGGGPQQRTRTIKTTNTQGKKRRRGSSSSSWSSRAHSPSLICVEVSSSSYSSSSSSPVEVERPTVRASSSSSSSGRKRRKIIAAAASEARRREEDCPREPLSSSSSSSSFPASQQEEEELSSIESLVEHMNEHSRDADVQLKCLKCLPTLLQDETHRASAQQAGLVTHLLRTLVSFPNHVKLHIRTFRALVVLLRPLGGCQEGMLFRTDGTHDDLIRTIKLTKNTGMKKHGIDVILDSMRRFATHAELQASAAWALVNVSLHPKRRVVVVKRGGVFALTNAMMLHPLDENVQFRALFALINLVIPHHHHHNKDNKSCHHPSSSDDDDDDSDDSSKYSTLRRILDPHVYQIARFAVLAVQHFPHHKPIVNRACLVLKNISLTDDYQKILVHTPHCYEMLQWCHKACAGYDKILAKSIKGTLSRLQLSNAQDVLKMRFLAAAAAAASGNGSESSSSDGEGSDSGTDATATTTTTTASSSSSSTENRNKMRFLAAAAAAAWSGSGGSGSGSDGGGGSGSGTDATTAESSTSSSTTTTIIRNGGSTVATAAMTPLPQSSSSSSMGGALEGMSDELKRVRSIRFGCPM